MEERLLKWMRLRFKIRDAEKQIEEMKARRDEMERELIAYVTADNCERRTVGKYITSVSYRRLYDYNIPLIRKLLEPRRLFDEVATVRIKHERFTTILATPGQFSDAEFEDLLGAMVVREAKEVLHVRRADARAVS
jgi:hypothetical protein